MIVTEGDYTNEGYIIREGFVEVARLGQQKRVLGILGPGDIFGEMSMLTGRPRSATVTARDGVVILEVIPARGVAEIAHLHPALAASILSTVVARLGAMNDYMDHFLGSMV